MSAQAEVLIKSKCIPQQQTYHKNAPKDYCIVRMYWIIAYVGGLWDEHSILFAASSQKQYSKTVENILNRCVFVMS